MKVMSCIPLSQHNRTGWEHPEALLLPSPTQKRQFQDNTIFPKRESPSEETQGRKKRYLWLIWQNHVSFLLLSCGGSLYWHSLLIIFTFPHLFTSKGHMARRVENFYIIPVRNTTLGILLEYINYSKLWLLEAVYINMKVNCDNHHVFQLASKKTVYWQNRVMTLWVWRSLRPVLEKQKKWVFQGS